MPTAVRPIAPIFVPPAVAGQHDALDFDQLQAVIEMVDRSHLVTTDATSGNFQIDHKALYDMVPNHAALVAAAVGRANVDPTLRAITMPVAPSADVAQVIADAATKLGKTNLIKNIETMIHGATPAAHWWGVTVDFTKEAADALAGLVGVDLTAILGIIAAVVPTAAAVLAIVIALAGGLAIWIKGENQGSKGVRIGLYMWVVPWVSAR